jgi:hypothetical protein
MSTTTRGRPEVAKLLSLWTGVGLAAGLVLACAGDGGREGGALSAGHSSASEASEATGESSGGEDGSTTSGSESGASGAGTEGTGTTADLTSGAGTTTTGGTSGASSTGASTGGIDCAPLTNCLGECVDISDDPTNCGGCGISCVVPHASSVCVASSCGLGQCDPSYGDCDGEVVNGCETQLEGGMECGAICKPGDPEVCNALDDNCDDVCDEGAGCRAGVHRSHSPSLGHVYTTDLNEAQSGDLTLEKQNFYYVYSSPHEGLVPFHRCTKGNGKPFYTKSANCEGNAELVGVIGYVANGPLCGATELYRLYHGGNGAHFYTTSASERDSAVAMFGFSFEKIEAFVWSGP